MTALHYMLMTRSEMSVWFPDLVETMPDNVEWLLIEQADAPCIIGTYTTEADADRAFKAAYEAASRAAVAAHRLT